MAAMINVLVRRIALLNSMPRRGVVRGVLTAEQSHGAFFAVLWELQVHLASHL